MNGPGKSIVIKGFFLLLIIGILSVSCTDDPCAERDFSSQIDLIFDVSGQMLVVNSCSEDLTYQYESQKYKIAFWKRHCHGENGSRFEFNYITDSLGVMEKQSLSPVEFKISNPDDVIEYQVFIVLAGGEEFELGYGESSYDEWEAIENKYIANGTMKVVYEIDDSGKFDWQIARFSMSFN